MTPEKKKPLRSEQEFAELEARRERERLQAEKVDQRFKKSRAHKPKYWWETLTDTDDLNPLDSVDSFPEIVQNKETETESVPESSYETITNDPSNQSSESASLVSPTDPDSIPDKKQEEVTPTEPVKKLELLSPDLANITIAEPKKKVKITRKSELSPEPVRKLELLSPDIANVANISMKKDQITRKSSDETSRRAKFARSNTTRGKTSKIGIEVQDEEPVKKSVDTNNPNELIFAAMRSIDQFQKGYIDDLEARHLIYVIKIASKEAMQLSENIEAEEDGSLKLAKLTETYIKYLLQFLKMTENSNTKLLNCLKSIAAEATTLITENTTPEKYQNEIRNSLLMVIRMNNDLNESQTKTRIQIACEVVSHINQNLIDIKQAFGEGESINGHLRELLRNVKELGYYQSENGLLPKVLEYLSGTCKAIVSSLKEGDDSFIQAVDKGIQLTSARLVQALQK
eukprot:TRINITY_DN9018_c0_g1_i1.p1 TRINITY_DN9018_c0_g1~~TRINITY_DN9018_c0_g1_i1.p1  ORF type:complete len:505 (+),score=122.70 TRINITY_DN9018_c0_g1_i1:142-1515(+)